MAFYIEEDRGHVMGKDMFAQRARLAVRGNVVNFHVQWECVFDALLKITSGKEIFSAGSRGSAAAQVCRHLSFVLQNTTDP